MVILLIDGSAAVLNNKPNNRSIYFVAINKTVNLKANQIELTINKLNSMYTILKSK
jgi:hypothetical protein